MSLFRSSFVVAAFTMLSRIFGYVRDVLIAAKLGAGVYSDVFFVAFRLPNMFRSLFAEGALNAAFIPMFSKMKGTEEAKRFADDVLSVMLVILLVISLIAQIFMPSLVWLIASGFAENEEKLELAVTLTRITFWYLLFISMVALFSGVLNSKGRFFPGAAAPVLLNLTLITILSFFAEGQLESSHMLSWGVFAGGVIQLVWMYFFTAKEEFWIRFKKPELNDQVKTLLSRMLPVLLGAGVLQINLLINTQLASYISDGAISYLYYADRISQLPLAIVGTAIGTALLPKLSQTKGAEYQQAQNSAILVACFLAVPAAFGIMFLAEPIISVLFERGEFGADDTINSARALAAYSLGIPAFVMVKIFTPGFYANDDTKTPVKVAAICILVNLAVSVPLIFQLGFDHVALAISTSVAAWAQLLLLVAYQKKQSLFAFEWQTISKILRYIVAAFGMWAALHFGDIYLRESVSGFLLLATLIICGACVYFILCKILGVLRLKFR